MTEVNNLVKMKELAEAFVMFSDMSFLENDSVNYTALEGECYGKALIKIKEVAVQMAIMNKGCILPVHNHAEIEILMLFEGDLTIEMKRGTVVLGVGDMIRFEPNEEHYPYTINGCKMIAITIPASDYYPSTQRNNNECFINLK